MYYNPMMNTLLRMLGQAAVESMMGGQRGAHQQQPPADDSPIDVEAQVLDEDGKTTEERAHERWEKERAHEAEHQLGGEVSCFGSKGYVLATGVTTVLLLLAGVAAGMVKVQFVMFPKNCWQL